MNDVIGVIATILLFAVILIGPAALVGAVSAGLVRASATRRGLPPAETHKKARTGFWIASIIALAIEIVLFGWCVSTLDGIG